MFKERLLQGMRLGVLSSLPFTLWALARTAPDASGNGGLVWLLEGAMFLLMAFAFAGCWNAVGAVLLLHLFTPLTRLPWWTRYAAAFVGSLLASCLGTVLIQALSRPQLPGVAEETLVLEIISATLLSVGFFSLDHRHQKAL